MRVWVCSSAVNKNAPRVSLHTMTHTCTPSRVPPPPPAPAPRPAPWAGNKLTALPADVGRLGRLRSLVLTGNQLAAVPVRELLSLPRLRVLAVAGNPLPAAALEQLREGMWTKGGMLCE